MGTSAFDSAVSSPPSEQDVAPMRHDAQKKAIRRLEQRMRVLPVRFLEPLTCRCACKGPVPFPNRLLRRNAVFDSRQFGVHRGRTKSAAILEDVEGAIGTKLD